MSDNGKMIKLTFHNNDMAIKHDFGNPAYGTQNKFSYTKQISKIYLRAYISEIRVPASTVRKRNMNHRKTDPVSVFVHQIVAVLFLSLRLDSQPYVHHRNGITWDNRVHNLKWVTPCENSIYKLGTPVQVIEQGSNKQVNFNSIKEVLDRYDLNYIPGKSFKHEGKKFLFKIVVIYNFLFVIFFIYQIIY